MPFPTCHYRHAITDMPLPTTVYLITKLKINL